MVMSTPVPNNEFYHTAVALAKQGISTIPIRDVQSKAPALSTWKELQHRTPTESELSGWYAESSAMALVGGEVQVMDFDVTARGDDGHLTEFRDLAYENGMLDILDDLPCQQTPSGGLHYFFRCKATPIRNMKLASTTDHKVLIETRGAGGYVLIAPSPGYVMTKGSLEDIPEISPGDREHLLLIARALDCAPDKTEAAHESPAGITGERPGDLFNADTEAFFALLREHGWESVKSLNYWRRPGKDHGVSATWDKIPGRFYVFSSNAYPLEPQKVYTPFSVYAQLEHNADFQAAAKQLSENGYGLMTRAKASLEEVRKSLSVEVLGDDDPDRWDPDDEPHPTFAVCRFFQKVDLTRGNISTISGKAKAGKSAFIQAMVGCHMGVDGDFLGWQVRDRQGAILYFDFEQGSDDFIWQCRRIFKRGNEDPRLHDYLRLYRLRDYPLAERRKRLIASIQRAERDLGAIDLIVLDGGSDLVGDVNSPEDSVAMVGEWLAMTSEYKAHMSVVIHSNEGNVSDKVRGHLGSESMRKSECTFSLEKVDVDRVHVHTPKHRRAGISDKEPFAFEWDEEQKMHVSVGQVFSKETMQKADRLTERARACFGTDDCLTRPDLINRMQQPPVKVSKNTAYTDVRDMIRIGVLEEVFKGMLRMKQ